MGGRGATAAGGGGMGGGAGGNAPFTVTVNANGTVTVTPNANAQALLNSGSGISDTNTHTTYFTPADVAIVDGSPTNGQRMSRRSGLMQNVGYYNTGDYYNVNTELRELAEGKRSTLTPQTQMVVDAMDRNMRPLNNAIDTIRWTDMRAIGANLGMPGADAQTIINNFKGGKELTRTKHDYTSSSWDAKDSGVAGIAGRNVLIKMHYAKGAKAQFSPTGKEGEMVGARGTAQRFSNPRIERVQQTNARRGGSTKYIDALVIDCYIDN